MDNNNKDLKIKHIKLELHLKYIMGICISVVAITIVAACYKNNSFVEQVSFAGMVSSIILSAIAIIMTIISETKTDNTKDKLINLSDNLEKIVIKIEKATNDYGNVISSNVEVKNQLNNINNTIQTNLNSINREVAVQINDTEIDKNNNCYTKIYKDMEGYINYQEFKNISVAIMYMIARKQKGTVNILYEEFVKDSTELKLNISGNLQIIWAITFVFGGGIWYNEEFCNFIFEYCSNRYFDEVNRIRNYINDNLNSNQ